MPTHIQEGDNNPNAGPTVVLPAVETLSLGATGPTITTPGTTLILEQQGDGYGITRLKMENRGGSNGFVAENAGLDLVDFRFLTMSSYEANIRYEGRGGNFGIKEFHITTDADPDTPSFSIHQQGALMHTAPSGSSFKYAKVHGEIRKHLDDAGVIFSD